jgi:hypothetical protein
MEFLLAWCRAQNVSHQSQAGYFPGRMACMKMLLVLHSVCFPHKFCLYQPHSSQAPDQPGVDVDKLQYVLAQYYWPRWLVMLAVVER